MQYLVSTDYNAWQSTSPQVTVKGFKKCCISNAVEGSDVEMWNASEDESNECEDGDNDTDW
jgi:hypothetical protein